MTPYPIDVILMFLLLISALGVIFAKKPVYAGLSFLASLLVLSGIYLRLGAAFTAVMQILIYAGAILIIFMFVIILFQDAYLYITRTASKSSRKLLIVGITSFVVAFFLFKNAIGLLPALSQEVPSEFGAVETIGKTLFIDFFFPFEAVVLLFLVGIIGAVYIGKREKV